MKALVYHGSGEKQWESKPDPGIEQPEDAIVRIDTTTICGTDLHILKGDVPTVEEGRTLGHEAVGTVVERGSAVRKIEEGDRVLVSCISSCGRCAYCKRGLYSQCLNGGGWILGHLVDGTQAEHVRIPFADNGLYKIRERLSDEQVLFLSDILPTGFEIGVLNGALKPGDTAAVVGAGPVGLAAIMTSRLYGPGRVIAIDPDTSRLERAREFGADMTIDNSSEDAVEKVMEATDGLGADVTIEAVGIPETFELCTELWIKSVTITTGLVDTSSTPTLLELVSEGRLDPTPFATHRFGLGEIMDAYDVFSDAAKTNALKVVLSAS
jgi:alcohol dehydrogenase